MAYTICDQYGEPKPIRLLLTNSQDVPRLGEPFTPVWWSCDPCNPSSSRYEVTHFSDQEKPTGYPWYQVVTSDDMPADVTAKLEHYAKILKARLTLEDARRDYDRLMGGR